MSNNKDISSCVLYHDKLKHCRFSFKWIKPDTVDLFLPKKANIHLDCKRHNYFLHSGDNINCMLHPAIFLNLTKRSHQSRKAKRRDAKQIVHQCWLPSFSCGGFICDAVSFYMIVNLSVLLSRIIIAFANPATCNCTVQSVRLCIIRDCDCLGAGYAGGDEMPAIMHNAIVT